MKTYFKFLFIYLLVFSSIPLQASDFETCQNLLASIPNLKPFTLGRSGSLSEHDLHQVLTVIEAIESEEKLERQKNGDLTVANPFFIHFRADLLDSKPHRLKEIFFRSTLKSQNFLDYQSLFLKKMQGYTTLLLS
jgi:hypothetical protein